MADFHFSPRANRAADINWTPWDERAFERAAAEQKPVLLGISAVWCHWCHVMDETSYSDPDVIDTINRDFVAVRVDNDERPDVNARYNMGGWPTTAFLTPDGSIITGFTYLPPSQMQRALGEIAHFYRESREQIDARAAELRSHNADFEPPAANDLNDGIVARVASAIAEGYDAEFGGFGNAPKFPQPEVLEFLLAYWRETNDPHFYEMVARTMREMARGGMYDHVEGGFFRYSTTRDWSVPHFEKMAEDHAGLLRVLAQLQTWTPHADWRAPLQSALQYVRTVLRDAKTGLFAGSQDADEEYFALDAESRATRTAPYVDRRSYSNWSAALAGAFAWASTALDDDVLAAESAATLDALHERLSGDDGLLYHVLPPGEAPRIAGLLTDQAAYLRALIDAHEHTGEARFLERARAHAERIVAHFGAEQGGFTDHARVEASIGRLQLADRPIVENGIMAESLLRLATLTGEPAYRERAAETLGLYAVTHDRAGQFAATYARALARYLAPEVSVKLEGSVSATDGFRETAFRLPTPFVCVATTDGTHAAAAYVCRGTTCAAPVSSAADLRAAYESAGASG